MAVVFTSHLPYTALHNEGGNFDLTSLFNIGTKTTCPVLSWAYLKNRP